MNPPTQSTAATVFSRVLLINGQPVTEPYGGLKFSGTVPGFGVSGIAAMQFEFDIYDEHGVYGTALLEDAAAELVGFFGEFRIAKRDISQKVCHFTAYDFSTDTSGEFDPSELWQNVTKDYITSGEVLSGLSSQLEISCTVSNPDDLDMQITREQLQGQSFNGILEMISESACGVWCGDGSGGLILIDLDNDVNKYAFGASSTEYGEIDYRGVQRIGRLIHTNSETGNTEENGGTTGNVISVENPLVARGDGLCGKVWQRVGGYQYQAWRCEKALLDEHVLGKRLLCSVLEFEGASPLIIGDFTLDIDSTGVYFSGGREPQSDERWGYANKVERTKIGIGKSVGSRTILSDGTNVFVNKNK